VARTSGHHGCFVEGSVDEMKQTKSVRAASLEIDSSCAEVGTGNRSRIGILSGVNYLYLGFQVSWRLQKQIFRKREVRGTLT
jgi:hypothetical protein